MFDVFRLMSPRHFTDATLTLSLSLIRHYTVPDPDPNPHPSPNPGTTRTTRCSRSSPPSWPSTRSPYLPTYSMAEYPQGLEFEDFSQMFSLSDLAKLTLNL
eukprot:scaffold16290_cov54-Phaeocystis_antarctica.AAC.2